MKPTYIDRVIWSQTTITHIPRKGKMVPIPPRVVWSKQVIRTYI